MRKATEPFTFNARFHLSELTGLRAASLDELLALIREVPGASIYHHTHRYLQQHEYLSPEPPNDFAHWAADALGDDELAERIASIDIIQFPTIRGIRERIAAVMEEYAARYPAIRDRRVRPGREFHFIKSVSFVLPTQYIVTDLLEFQAALDKVSTNCIYFHMFEARLRLEKQGNDFSRWIEDCCGDAELAAEIARLDPYTYAMDDLRRLLVRIVAKRIPAHGQN